MRRAAVVTAALVAAALLAGGRPAHAGGFMHFEHSALSTGMANTRTALWDDPSSLFTNPAAITELHGYQLSLGVTLLMPGVDYKPDYAECPDTKDCANPASTEFHVFPPPHAYFTAEATPWLSVGIGYYSPFGLGTYWPEDWDGRFAAYQTYIETHLIQPTVALDIARLAKLNRDFALSFAVGGIYAYGKAELKQKVDASLVSPGAEYEMELEGDAHSGGFLFALFAAYKPWVSIGASVRSGISMPFEGKAHFNLPEGEPWAPVVRGLGLAPETTTGAVTIDMPWHVNAGIAFHGIPRTTLAMDVHVTFFQSYNTLALNFDCEDSDPPNNCGAALNDGASYPKKWSTTVQVSLGVEVRPIEALALRAGYGHVTKAANPAYYDPQLPDGNRHLVTFGIGYRAPRIFKVDLGYMLALWQGEKHNDVGDTGGAVENSTVNGTYETTTHIVAITLGFMFGGPTRGVPPTLSHMPFEPVVEDDADREDGPEQEIEPEVDSGETTEPTPPTVVEDPAVVDEQPPGPPADEPPPSD